MALFINGVGQDTFSMNGVSIDNLYVDGVLVWSSYVNTKPVISIIGDNPTYLVLDGSAYIEQGATANDLEDGDITSDIVIGGDSPDVSIEGYYYVTYNVTDSDGLAADEQIRTVSVYVVTVPKYELTEALTNDGTFDYVPDSNNPESSFQGKLTESDGTTPYLPTELQYPQNGLLELDAGRIMDTQFDIDFENSDYAAYGIYDADGSTTYKIWAISINSALNLYDLYEGDQDTPIAWVDVYNISVDHFPVPWTVTDGRPSWLPVDTLRTPAYISLNYESVPTAEPVGIDIFGVYSKGLDLNNILDIEGNATDYTCQLLQIFNDGNVGSITGDDSECISDYTITNSPNTIGTVNIEIYLPEGTFEIQVGANIDLPSTSDFITDYTIDGQTQTISASTSGNVDGYCKTFTITSTGAMYTLICAPSLGGLRSVLNGFRITEVQP